MKLTELNFSPSSYFSPGILLPHINRNTMCRLNVQQTIVFWSELSSNTTSQMYAYLELSFFLIYNSTPCYTYLLVFLCLMFPLFFSPKRFLPQADGSAVPLYDGTMKTVQVRETSTPFGTLLYFCHQLPERVV